MIFPQAEGHFALTPGRRQESRKLESGLESRPAPQQQPDAPPPAPGLSAQRGQGAGLARGDHVTTEAAPVPVARSAVTSAYGAGR